MVREKLDTEIRQEQILGAALELISTHGMKGLNMGALARRVGLVPSALYRHFQNKDRIVEALLGLIGKRLAENVAAVRREAKDPLDALEMLLRLHVGLIRANAGIPRVVFSEEVYGADSGRRTLVYEILSRYLHEVETFFQEACDAGLLREGLPGKELPVMFIGLFQPAAILWHVSGGAFDVTRHAERAWALFRASIARP